MIDESSRPGFASEDDQRRILELQLIKIRNEASAARLEARAAELELMIRQLGSGGPSSDSAKVGSVSGPLPAGVGSEAEIEQAPPSTEPIHNPSFVTPTRRFANWNEVRSARQGVMPAQSRQDAGVGDVAVTDPSMFRRVDTPQYSVPRPHFLAPIEEGPDSPSVDESSVDTSSVAVVEDGTSGEQPFSAPSFRFGDDTTDERPPADLGEVAIDDDKESEPPKRSRPAAWLVSAITHAVVLLLLALITLQTHRPKDQVALSASASETNETAMETFTIESSEPETDPTEPTPSETEYELSPLGEIAASDFAPDAPPAPPAAASMASSSQMSAAAMSLSSDSDAKIQFCGVEGGGNHFVYLVDSSGSMGDAFNSAREELLHSIDALKPEQRFYVVFFDAESDFMRLSNAKQDEPRSVHATTANKASLKRWAMRISMDRGRAPYDPLKFALKLKPDVIFLLSDGEFPQGIEDLLKEENKFENLFGDSGPISIVHTIGYHSREGESRMRRIAEQNEGQYRHVPKP